MGRAVAGRRTSTPVRCSSAISRVARGSAGSARTRTLINPRLGSFFFLGALLVDLELDAGRAVRGGPLRDVSPVSRRVSDGGVRRAAGARCDAVHLVSHDRAEGRDSGRAAGADRRALYGCDICQEVCPWNVRFAQELKEPAFAAREVIAGKDARTLAREILAMSDEDFRTAFKGSPMKRAKLRGLKRNAAVVLGNVGDARDEDVLAHALDPSEPLVQQHAEWALERIRDSASSPFEPGSATEW